MKQSYIYNTSYNEYSELESFLLLTAHPSDYFEEEKSKELRKLISRIRANPFPKKRQKYLEKFIKKYPNEMKELLLDPFVLFFDIDEELKNLRSGKVGEQYDFT